MLGCAFLGLPTRQDLPNDGPVEVFHMDSRMEMSRLKKHRDLPIKIRVNQSDVSETCNMQICGNVWLQVVRNPPLADMWNLPGHCHITS